MALPLSGLAILVTRALEQSDETARLIAEHGGEAILCPTIRIQENTAMEDVREVDESLRELDTYDWLLFTSSNGVKYFQSAMLRNGIAANGLNKPRIAAIGPRTAEAARLNGLRVDIVAESYEQEGLYEAIRPHLQAGQKVLMAKAKTTREYLPQKLRNSGLRVCEAAVYETVPELEIGSEAIIRLQSGGIDVITFASSSAVNYFMARLQRLGIQDPLPVLKGVKIACIGTITEQTAHRHGLTETLTGMHSTVHSMIEAIAAHRHR